MRRYRAILLVLAAVTVFGMVSPAMGQSSNRLGLGYNVTFYDGEIVAHMPKFVFQGKMFTAGAGFQLHSGEDLTNFMLEMDFSARAIRMRSASIGFGGQIDLTTDVVVANKKETAFGFGAFCEGLVDVAPNLSVGVRVFPFEIATVGDWTRFGLFGVGLSVSFLF